MRNTMIHNFNPRLRSVSIWTILTVCFVHATMIPLIAQETAPASEDTEAKVEEKTNEVEKQPNAQSKAVGVDLFLLVHSPPTLLPNQLQQDMSNALAIAFPGKIFKFDQAAGGISVSPISASNFASLQSLVGGDIRQSQQPLGDQNLTSDLNKNGVWSVKIGEKDKPDSLVEWIEIDMDKGKDEQGKPLLGTVKYTLEGFGKGARFVKNSAYLGTLELDPADRPVKYRIKTKGSETTKDVDWPQPTKHFFVCLKGFQGGEAGRDQLLQVLRESAIASRFVGLPIERTVLLSYASVNLKVGLPPRTWFENKLLMTFDAIDLPKWDNEQKVGPARVWVLFPLTTAEKDQVTGQLLQKAAQDREDISKFIRDNTYPIVLSTGQTATVNELPQGWVAPDAQLNNSPAWYEIPIDPSNGSYRRAFQLQGNLKWQDGAGPWSIAIYETQFRVEGEPENFRKYLPIELEKSLWKIEQFRQWGKK